MKTITGSWFFATVKVDAETPDGMVKRTSEQYVVDAMTFTECEARVTEEVTGGGVEVAKESKAPFSEIFLSEDNRDNRWYKVKVKIITLDEKTGKEKKSSVVYLVQAKSNETAAKYAKEVMDETAMDYELADVVETGVVDVFRKE